MAGKGDKCRTSDRKVYRNEHERIFGKKELPKVKDIEKPKTENEQEIQKSNEDSGYQKRSWW